MDHYAKIKKRVGVIDGFSFFDPCLEKKKEVLFRLKKSLEKRHIRMHLCCEKELLETLPETADINQSACIPNHRLKALYGGNISLKIDKGQRVRAGCGCRVSADVGSYHLHPCFHNCLFCYANPAEKRPNETP